MKYRCQFTSTKTHLFLFIFTALSSRTTLKELFPESNGEVFPPIVPFRYLENPVLKNLRRILKNKLSLLDRTTTLLRRNNLIIGWEQNDQIERITNLNIETNIVFDTRDNEFKILSSEELRQLGVGRVLTNVLAIDKFAAERRAKYQAHIQASHHAHIQACRQADLQGHNRAIHSPKPKAESQADNQVNIQAIHRAYEQAYDQTYSEAYHLYLSEHGHN